MSVVYTKAKGGAPQPYNLSKLPPPELPPRALSPEQAVTNVWHPQRQVNTTQSPPRLSDQTVSTASTGRSYNPTGVSTIFCKFIVLLIWVNTPVDLKKITDLRLQ
jgi:hypothetical protein